MKPNKEVKNTRIRGRMGLLERMLHKINQRLYTEVDRQERV